MSSRDLIEESHRSTEQGRTVAFAWDMARRILSSVRNFQQRMRAVEDLDTDGITLRGWEQLCNDLLRFVITVTATSVALVGVLLSGLYLGGRTPSMLHLGEIFILPAIEVAIYCMSGMILLYIFKAMGIYNVFTPQRSKLSKFQQVKHLILTIGVAFLFLIPIGLSLGSPVAYLFAAKNDIPELFRYMRCEEEHWRSLEKSGYVIDVACDDIVEILQSPARVSKRHRAPYLTNGE